MRRTSLYCLLVIWVTVFCLGLEAKDTKRSKRQMSVMYVCGNAPNTFVSQNPCQNQNYGNYGCGQNLCNNNYNNYQQNAIIPQSFYNPGTNCYNSCNNFNCNNYNGQYMNGQYVAYQMGSNQYSPCASNCCGFNQQPIQFRPTLHDPFSTLWGSFNNWRLPHNNNGYQIGTGATPTGFTGTQVLDAQTFGTTLDNPYDPNRGVANLNQNNNNQAVTVGGNGIGGKK